VTVATFRAAEIPGSELIVDRLTFPEKPFTLANCIVALDEFPLGKSNVDVRLVIKKSGCGP